MIFKSLSKQGSCKRRGCLVRGVFPVVFLGLLFSCSEQKKESNGIKKNVTSNVVAVVNGENITEQDIDYTLSAMFAKNPNITITENIKSKVLESLISAKAMKQKISAEMSEQQLQAVAAQVNKYEEELYVKEYLSRYSLTDPVTSQMVETYYKDNIDLYSSASFKVFELLTAKNILSEQSTKKFSDSYQQIKTSDDWQGFQKKGVSGIALAYKKSKVRPGLLDKKLSDALATLSAGETSGIIFYQDKPAILRVNSVEAGVAKPLNEVADSIRRVLAPMQLKKTIKTLTENVVAQSDVKRLKYDTNNGSER